MQNDCYLIQMTEYKQMPLHKRSTNALGKSEVTDSLHYLKSFSKKTKELNGSSIPCVIQKRITGDVRFILFF